MFCRKCGRELKKSEIKCRYCGEPMDTEDICGGFRGLVHSDQLSIEQGKTKFVDNWTGPGTRFEDIISDNHMVGNRNLKMKSAEMRCFSLGKNCIF